MGGGPGPGPVASLWRSRISGASIPCNRTYSHRRRGMRTAGWKSTFLREKTAAVEHGKNGRTRKRGSTRFLFRAFRGSPFRLAGWPLAMKVSPSFPVSAFAIRKHSGAGRMAPVAPRGVPSRWVVIRSRAAAHHQ
ncbi:hypothetical protein TVNIR_0244 [Thioalkalivibrio nitratireducens DSM 14787]|uniref:Uncharacterized protein n=1 Tax=Thioalkalivibrio nitratireducens (strain DSM 14787 / UNIQEM 213 / ALEN2) TaxID=1255043 RepID=L0DSJ9_THIND|nr:hypothetical protein TVNIR_0244 [Thioalkalivibrio nitratireducens DSM 14787]